MNDEVAVGIDVSKAGSQRRPRNRFGVRTDRSRSPCGGIAALVGVAPVNRDSGTLRGRRMVWGGRADVRTALYMSTIVAVRFNPIIKSTYLRLRAAGKPPKLALAASMCKLLTILNAMLKHRTPWSPKCAELA